MSDRPLDLLIEDILEAIRRIESYLSGATKSSFLDDQMMQDAVIRNITVIGEVVSRLPDTFTSKHNEIAWSRIRGMRNRLVHDYLGIDFELVWEVTQKDLAEFHSQIEKLK